LRASIALSHEQGRTGDIAVQLRLIARVKGAQSHLEEAVRLQAAASSLTAHATTMPPTDPAADEALRETLRTTLGDRRFEAEWTLGAAMPLEQMVKAAVSSSAA
jgi:hypothetical protein